VWTHPRQAAKQAQRDRETSGRWRVERASFAWPGIRTETWKVARMATLRAAGVQFSAIARVMAIDFPGDERLTEDRVRYLLYRGHAAPPGCCEGCGTILERRPGQRPKRCDACRETAR
jgi:hypothetical protein